MKAGFIGSCIGIDSTQCAELKRLLVSYGITELHHGMCVGADEQANLITRLLGIRTIGHLPLAKFKYAPCVVDEVRPPKGYIERNHNIVNETIFLFVGPSCSEQMRSGTWATKCYADKMGKPFHVLERG